LNVPGTHYYFCDSLQFLNAASGRIGTAPLQNQKVDEKDERQNISNGVVLNIKTLSAKYPGFKEQIGKIKE